MRGSLASVRGAGTVAGTATATANRSGVRNGTWDRDNHPKQRGQRATDSDGAVPRIVDGDTVDSMSYWQSLPFCCAGRGWTLSLTQRLWTILGVLFLLGSGALKAYEPLPRARPETMGVDSGKLDGAINLLSRVSGAQAVVVVCKGRVIGEEYWLGNQNTLRHVRSVTKSVSSTLAGIAIDRGFISSVDSPIVDYLPAGLHPADPAGDAITVRHLLTMTAGWRWDENQEFQTWAASPDPIAYILARPLVTEAGTSFNYSSASAHVLSPLLAGASGLDEAAFADSNLFQGLGIERWAWTRDDQGRPFGGHGLQLRTEDEARIGILFLNRGSFGGRRIVPPGWAREATSIQYRGGSSWESLEDIHYGYLWWLARSLGHRVFIAWGWGGQFVFCVPDLELVVATNARWNVYYSIADRQEREMMDVIVNHIQPLFPILHPLDPVPTSWFLPPPREDGTETTAVPRALR